MDFQISAEDENLLTLFRWRVDANGYLARAEMAEGKTRTIFLHRVIVEPPEWMHVDHIDGNPGNNSRENLRLCTHAQNMKNRKLNKNSTTGFKGVYVGQHGTFRAEIKADGRRIGLGTYKTAEEAGQAYWTAAQKYHGEFARFN